MAENSQRTIADKVKQFTQKFDENHDEIEFLFNKELKRSLSKSELQDKSAEECDDLIKTLTEALELVEGKASHTLAAVKDNLKQAKIDALERKLGYCTCKQNVTFRKERSSSNSLRPGSETSNASRDSRVKSDPGDMPVVHPSDAFKDDPSNDDNPTGEEKQMGTDEHR